MKPDKTKSKSSKCNLSVRITFHKEKIIDDSDITFHKEKIIDDSYTLGDSQSDFKAWVPSDSWKDPAVFRKLNMQNRKEKLMSRKHEENIELHVILQDSDHPTQSTHSKEVPLGLENRGTNCYANVVLQVLKATIPFSTYLSGDEYGGTCSLNDGCLSCSLRTFIQDALEKSEPFYPSMILDRLESFGDDFARIDQIQKDSAEFLRVLLRKFEEESVKHPKNETIHHELFDGMILTESECICGGKDESALYSFDILDIHVQPEGQACFTSLKDMMDHYTSKKESTPQCTRCNLPMLSDQRKIIRDPNILIIALERMIYATKFSMKVRNGIDCPMELDISPYMSDSAESTENKYELYGAVEHVGGPLKNYFSNPAKHHGHFISYTRCNKQWYKIDDANVTALTEEQVETNIRNSSLLLYTRKTGEDREPNVGQTFEQTTDRKVDSDMPFNNSPCEEEPSLSDSNDSKLYQGCTAADLFLPNSEKSKYLILEDISKAEVRQKISDLLADCTPEKHTFYVPVKKHTVYVPELGAYCEPISKDPPRCVCSTIDTTKIMARRIYKFLTSLLEHLDDGPVQMTGLKYQQGPQFAANKKHGLKPLSKNTKWFPKLVDTVCRMLRATRASLDINLSPKGKIMGPVKMKIKGITHIDCSDGKAHLIPHDSHLIDEISGPEDLKFILIIEKEPTLTKLKARKFAETYNCIILCGKGHSDMATRRLAYKLSVRFPVPVYGFVDHNAGGALIVLTYKYGSRGRSYDNFQATVPSLQWIGMHTLQCYRPSVAFRPKYAPEGSKEINKVDQKKLFNYLQAMPVVFTSSRDDTSVQEIISSGFTMDIEQVYPYGKDLVNLLTQLIPETRKDSQSAANGAGSQSAANGAPTTWPLALTSPSKRNPIRRELADFNKRRIQLGKRLKRAHRSRVQAGKKLDIVHQKRGNHNLGLFRWSHIVCSPKKSPQKGEKRGVTHAADSPKKKPPQKGNGSPRANRPSRNRRSKNEEAEKRLEPKSDTMIQFQNMQHWSIENREVIHAADSPKKNSLKIRKGSPGENSPSRNRCSKNEEAEKRLEPKSDKGDELMLREHLPIDGEKQAVTNAANSPKKKPPPKRKGSPGANSPSRKGCRGKKKAKHEREKERTRTRNSKVCTRT